MRRLDDRELRVSYGSNTVAKLSELVPANFLRGARQSACPKITRTICR